MTITASSILVRAGDILNDRLIRWRAPQLVRSLNFAQRAIVTARPDAINVCADVALAAGARQNLDAMSLTPLPVKLIQPNRNTAATSRKGAVTKTDRHMLDAYNPDWYGNPGSINIQQFMYDPREPRVFHVYPPALAGARLEINYGAYPTDIAIPAETAGYLDVVGNLSVPDVYDSVVLDLVLYQSFSIDDENGNEGRAASHRAAAIAVLGAELAATLAVQPRPNRNPTMAEG